MFSPTSRYAGLETRTWETPTGELIIHVQRRIIPPAATFAQIQAHTVTSDDRPDLLAARYLGDPEQAWMLCDGNAAMQPDELTETLGQKLRITLPAGIPGTPHA